MSTSHVIAAGPCRRTQRTTQRRASVAAAADQGKRGAITNGGWIRHKGHCCSDAARHHEGRRRYGRAIAVCAAAWALSTALMLVGGFYVGSLVR
jgi:hypothetical protein